MSTRKLSRPLLTPTAPAAAPGEIPESVAVAGASTTRDRLIEAAEELFNAEGFHAVGLDRILAKVGISKQGFYRHFASKEDLVLEVILAHDRWWREECPKLLRERAGDDPRAQLEAYVDLLIEVLEGHGFRGCFFVNAISEFPSPADPIHRAALQAKNNIGLLIRDLALRAGADDPVALAQEFGLLFEGAFATRWLQKTADVIPVIRRMVAHLFDQRLPLAARGSAPASNA